MPDKVNRAEGKTMSNEKETPQGRFPPGWDEDRAGRVLRHYEQQTEDEAVAEDEAGTPDSSRTVIEAPTELAPVIRDLLARHPA